MRNIIRLVVVITFAVVLLPVATSAGSASAGTFSSSPRMIVYQALRMIHTTPGVHIAGGVSEGIYSTDPQRSAPLIGAFYRADVRYKHPTLARVVEFVTLGPICFTSNRTIDAGAVFASRHARNDTCTKTEHRTLRFAQIGMAAAEKNGGEPWQCGTIASGNAGVSGAFSGFSSLKAYPRLNLVGGLPLPGIATWDMSSSHGVWQIVASGPQRVQTGEADSNGKIKKLYSMVNVVTTFLVSSVTGQLRHESSQFKLPLNNLNGSPSGEIVQETDWNRFGHYGVAPKVQLPPACAP